MDIERAGMNGVGGLLRGPKTMRIEPHRFILYEATIFDFLHILIAYEKELVWCNIYALAKEQEAYVIRSALCF